MLVPLVLRAARPRLVCGVRGLASTSRLATEAEGEDAPKAKPKAKKAAGKITSVLQAGTVMQGLSVFKDKPDPVALPEDQYPPWLWTLLDEKVPVEGQRDFKADRKRLRAQNRVNIKAANYLKTT